MVLCDPDESHKLSRDRLGQNMAYEAIEEHLVATVSGVNSVGGMRDRVSSELIPHCAAGGVVFRTR